MRGMHVFPAVLAMVGFATAAAWAAEIELPEGPGRELVYGQCRTCHDLQYLKESAGITRDDWDQIIISMGQYGLRIPPDMRAKILDYLGTYLGPNPPKATGTAKAEQGPLDGKAIFAEQCQPCHQANGKGLAGQFPPLAGNRDLFRDELLPVYVLLNGLQGRVEIDGKTFNSAMPSFAHLTDRQISAVIGYVRSAWGNDKLRPAGFKEVDADAVTRARGRKMTPEEVLSYRSRLK